MQVRDISEQMSVFVCFVFVLFVNVCQQWACELEDVKLLVGLVQDGDVGLEVGDEDLGGDGAAPRRLVNIYCALLNFLRFSFSLVILN